MALVVDDLDGLLAELKKAGIEPEKAPYAPGGRTEYRICFVADPDGYRRRGVAYKDRGDLDAAVAAPSACRAASRTERLAGRPRRSGAESRDLSLDEAALGGIRHELARALPRLRVEVPADLEVVGHEADRADEDVCRDRLFDCGE